MARLAAEGRREEGERDLERGLRADDAGAEGQDVHVVVLDALVRRVRVVADGGADAADLVGRDAGADARAADQDAAVRLAARRRRARAARRSPGSRRPGRAVATEVDQLVAEAGRREPAQELVLEGGPGVIGGERDAHRRHRIGVDLRAEVAAVQRRDAAAEALADDPPADVGDALDREAEVLEDRPGRRRRPEVVEPDDRALVADPALPAERDADLDADAPPDRGGRTASRYASSCASNRSQQGSETTRVAIPSASSASAAANASWSSEPVPMRISAGVAARSPRAGRSRRARRPRGRARRVPGSVGSFWRVRARAIGPSRRSTASAQAAAVSLASPGRTNHRFGIARSAA